jgi:uncharacterized protein (TIRG00374 family)
MFLFTHASISDIFAVGLIPFTTSVVSIIGKIMLQAFRFKYFIAEFIGPDVSSTWKIIYARLAGEFVTQTTPSYVGGELVRIAFLTKNGVSVGRAAWVTTMEIIADVFVGTTLAFIAGAVSIYNGGDFIGFAVILVAIPTLAFWLSLLVFSAKRNLRLPFFSKKVLRKLMSKDKADRMIDSANNAIADLCKMSRENFNSVKAVKVFILGIALTLATFLLQGVSFMVLANAVGSNIGFLGSLLATSASTVLSTLPITIGGSGLAELGIWAYISNLNGIPSLKDVLNSSQLSVIIAWRIASYHIPLIIMWIALMRLTIGKVSLENTHANSPFALDKKNNDLSKTTATNKKNLEEHSDDKR